MVRVALGAALGFTLALLSVAVVLGWTDGAINGVDSASYPAGSDNPDGLSGSYCYDNIYHNKTLYEYNDPSTDYIKDSSMVWSAQADQTLAANNGIHFLVYEQTVKNQFYYNYTGGWITNLPHTSSPEGEGAVEEALQGYSEVDMELHNTTLIVPQISYFFQLYWQSEQPPTQTAPLFESYCQWEDYALPFHNIRNDATGQFRKGWWGIP